VPRSDAIENLITSIEIASARKENGEMLVSEVCIFFNHNLIRGNRAQKVENQFFDAFESENYPLLARSGVEIDYNFGAIQKFGEGTVLKTSSVWEQSVSYLKLFPGIKPATVQNILHDDNLRGVIIETFGSGNGPTNDWFADEIKEANRKGLVMFNVSQCLGGKVMQGKYETSKLFQDNEVVSGRDITSEAALAKMMYLLGNSDHKSGVKSKLGKPLRGEMI